MDTAGQAKAQCHTQQSLSVIEPSPLHSSTAAGTRRSPIALTAVVAPHRLRVPGSAPPWRSGGS